MAERAAAVAVREEPAPSPGTTQVRLKPGADGRLLRGHPWVFSNEIAMSKEVRGIPRGTVATLTRVDGKPLATAFFNPHTLIAGRVLTRAPAATIDRAFIADRLSAALKLRDRLFDRPFYRLVHAEADQLPGLIVDRHGDVLVAQLNAAGTDQLAGEIVGALADVVGPRHIVLRNDTTARAMEGLGQSVEQPWGAVDGQVTVEEGGTVFFIDPIGGQKTGWFYDHRDNRAFMAGLAHGASVLDVYAYLGGFGLRAARAGATAVTCVDRSETALAGVAAAAKANGVEARVTTRRGDGFGVLEELGAADARFDLVIADPPAFAKAKKDVPAALKGYRKLARLAARVTAPGGILMIASCSHHVDAAAFHDIVGRGLIDARRTGRILRQAGAGPDHPEHPFLPESRYLKALALALD